MRKFHISSLIQEKDWSLHAQCPYCYQEIEYFVRKCDIVQKMRHNENKITASAKFAPVI